VLTTGRRLLQFLFLAAAVALPGAAKPRHAPKPPDICVCDPPPTAHPLPSAEALALARRIVKAVDGAIIWHRVRELVLEAERHAVPA
jgi:hypothetical protein